MLAGMIGVGVMVAVIVFFSYYKVDTVEVRGTSHYTDEEVKNMVLRGPMASNSVLAPLLYSTTNTEDIAYVDAFKVTQLNRNTICISVKEKKQSDASDILTVTFILTEMAFLWRVLRTEMRRFRILTEFR